MEKMKHNEEVHDHCTCQNSDLHIQFCRTTLLKNRSTNLGIQLYNKLPNTMKRLEKLQKFKKKTEIFFTATHFLFSG